MTGESSLLLSRRDLSFLLYEWLGVDKLTSRSRFAGHSRETFDAALDLYEQLARDKFLPHNKRNDEQEPHMVDGRVWVNPDIREAIKAFCEAGLIAAAHDEELGGMQLPYVLDRAGMAYMFAANPSSIAYPFLTMANANLLLRYGTPAQAAQYVRPMLEGRFFGTMCLSEPQAGSSLSDIKTRALSDADGNYRLFGNKMWISGGDHELADNIIHLVLAKIVNEQGELEPGVRGISLFIVPKRLITSDGGCAEQNDLSVVSLNHKMGFRGTANCALSFGDSHHRPGGRAGAVAILLGEPGQGLNYMFHMMNEARIGIGLAAAAIGYTGYLHALSYARARLQGRSSGDRAPGNLPVPIIQHADVRRMLLAQKVYVEGALALALYSALLFDEQGTAELPEDRVGARELLDLLTPITKSWPSEWCVIANDLAIQVHGGYGYARDHNVEQFYRDNRLNPIHEGTQGIQAIDLLGRKVRLLADTALRKLGLLIGETIREGRRSAETCEHAGALAQVWAQLDRVTAELGRLEDPSVRLANATAYLQAFGHVVVAWIWLSQALRALQGLSSTPGGTEQAFYLGKLSACRYFFRWELPRVDGWLKILSPVDRTCLDMADAWF